MHRRLAITALWVVWDAHGEMEGWPTMSSYDQNLTAERPTFVSHLEYPLPPAESRLDVSQPIDFATL